MSGLSVRKARGDPKRDRPSHRLLAGGRAVIGLDLLVAGAGDQPLGEDMAACLGHGRELGRAGVGNPFPRGHLRGAMGYVA